MLHTMFRLNLPTESGKEYFKVLLTYMGMVASIMIINFHFLGSER